MERAVYLCMIMADSVLTRLAREANRGVEEKYTLVRYHKGRATGKDIGREQVLARGVRGVRGVVWSYRGLHVRRSLYVSGKAY